MVRRPDALVQADRRRELRLQLRVVDDVVVRQRLLDHHQVELIQPPQVIDVRQRVRRVRVRHQPDLRKRLPHRAHHFHVPARTDLDLDPLVARVHFGLDLLEQLLHRILNPDRHPARDLAVCSAADLLPQRLPVQPRRQVPARGLQAPARHAVPANVRAPRCHFARGFERMPEHPRRGVFLQNHPCRVHPLLVVEGVLAARHFAVAARARRVHHLHQHHLALVRASETRLEEVHQRHANLPQNDLLYLEGHGEKRYVPAESLRSNPVTASPARKFARKRSLIEC